MSVRDGAIDGESSDGQRVEGTPRGPRLRGAPTQAHLEKLEAIKAVAAEEFYHWGYAATDLRRIARASSMHVASLYNYISSKEDLLALIMEDGVEEINARLDEALDGVEDPLERLRRGLQSHILHHAHRGHVAAVSHNEVRSLTGDERGRMVELRREYEARWDRLILDGMDAGVIAPVEDPRVVVYALLAVGQSVARWYDPDGRLSAAELSGRLTDLLLFGLVGRPQAGTAGD